MPKEAKPAREIRIEYLPLGELKKWPQNPKRHELGTIGKSIARFGFVNPLIINEKTGELLAGHGRLEALESREKEDGTVPDGVKVSDEGVWLVPVVRGISLTGKQAEAYAIADNRLVEIGGWNDRMLADLLQGIDLEGVGYSQADIDELLIRISSPKEGLIDDDELPENVKTLCKIGDLWQLGEHRLLCGDATKHEDVERLMGVEKADMVFFDPPYGVNYGKDQKEFQRLSVGKYCKTRKYSKMKGDALSTKEIAERIWKPSFSIMYEFAKDNCSFYMTMCQGGSLMMMMMMMMEEHWIIKHELIWVKNHPVFSMGRLDYDNRHEPILYGWKLKHKFYGYGAFRNSVWEIPKPNKSELHPTMKPIALIENCLLNSTKASDIIADLFGGSGSTLIACEKLRRRCCMMEIAPYYCDIIIARWEAFTGQKAVML